LRADVEQFLNDHFPDRWAGIGGQIAWTPRSPNFTPLGCFLWGCVKDVGVPPTFANRCGRPKE
jgi:hypothetical protein